MGASQTADFRALLGGGSDEDRVAAAHMLIGAIFLVVGGFLQLLALFSLRFADIFPISFGRLESAANLNLMIGFGVISLMGGIYYVLPRLTGARLWNRDLAAGGLLTLSGFVVVGTLAIFFGMGSGRQPLGLPWWLNLPLVALLAIPTVITAGTVMNREEKRSYVTLWFVMGGVAWLPLLGVVNSIGDLPFLSSVSKIYADTFVSAGYVTMWLFTVGAGLFYYTVVKELDIPLASRQLASVGFWSMGFAAIWWGVAQTTFGPGPGWVSGVAAGIGLAFPLGMLANASNVSLTLEGNWDRLNQNPGISSGVFGLFLGVVVGSMAAIAAFPSVASVTALTSYWEAIEFASLMGVGPLLVAAVTIHALPRLVGREIHNPARARSFNQLTIIGTGGVLLGLGAAGVLSGYSWVSGANSAAYVGVGEGWNSGAGLVETLYLIAFGFGLIALTGIISYASVLFGTVSSGKAVSQEVLVTDDDLATVGSGGASDE